MSDSRKISDKKWKNGKFAGRLSFPVCCTACQWTEAILSAESAEGPHLAHILEAMYSCFTLMFSCLVFV